MKITLISSFIILFFGSLTSWSGETDSSKFSISVDLQTYLPGITEYHIQEHLSSISLRRNRSAVFISSWVYSPFKSYWRRSVFQIGLRHFYLVKGRHQLSAELSYLTTRYISHLDGVYSFNYNFDQGIGNEALILEKINSHNLHITSGYAYSILKSKKLFINVAIGAGIQRNFSERDPSGIFYPNGPTGGYLDLWRTRLLLTAGFSYQFYARKQCRYPKN